MAVKLGLLLIRDIPNVLDLPNMEGGVQAVYLDAAT